MSLLWGDPKDENLLQMTDEVVTMTMTIKLKSGIALIRKPDEKLSQCCRLVYTMKNSQSAKHIAPSKFPITVHMVVVAPK